MLIEIKNAEMTVNGRHVNNWFLKSTLWALAAVVVISCGILLLPLVPIVGVIIILAVTLALFTIPLHIILRCLGRKGFFAGTRNGFSWSLSAEGFRKVP